MATFSITPIIPKEINVAQFTQAITRSLDEETKADEKEFRNVTDKFTGSDPKFPGKPDYDRKVVIGNDAIGITKTNDGRVWFLNHGVSPRRAILSNDWQSKTNANSLNTRAGRGRVVKIDPNFRGKAVEARNWDKLIAKKRTKPFERLVNKNLKQAADNAF